MKSKFLCVILVILMLVPTVLAFAVYNPPIEEAAENPNSITSISIVDTNGKIYELTDKAERDLVLSIISGAKSSPIPDPILNTEAFKLNISTDNMSNQYMLYLSTNPADTYLASGGKTFAVDSVEAEKLLKTKYALCLYTNSFAPTLSIGNTEILPSSFEWQYKIYDGTFAASTDIKLAPSPATVNTTSSIDAEFSDKPDYLYLKLTNQANGGETLFEGNYDDFKGLTTDSEITCQVELTAKWYTTGERNNYGNGVYSFTAICSPNAKYSFSTDTVKPGGVVTVKVKNISDISKLSLSSDPAMDFVPTFYKNNEDYIALIPFDYGCTQDQYVLTFTYGTISYSKVIKTEKAEFNSKEYKNDADYVSEFINDTTIAEINKIFETVDLIEGSPSWFASKFTSGTYRAEFKTGYGIYMTIAATGNEYRHIGCDADTATSNEVRPMSEGKVIYIGESKLFGGIVVVDHGLGLKTWYCRVGDIKVAVGDMVDSSTLLANGNDSGFGDKNRVHISATIGNKFISPSILISNGVTFSFQ